MQESENGVTERNARNFYDVQYGCHRYSNVEDLEEHPCAGEAKWFAAEFGLAGKKCLEVGCGRGAFQSLVRHYVGVDISAEVGPSLDKPFVVASAARLPFQSEKFAAIWSFHALEHVMAPEHALAEMRRVLEPMGLLLLAPAWHCRPWAAQGYATRRYSDLSWQHKLVKASLIVRERLLWRACSVLPRRIWSLMLWLAWRMPVRMRYKRLQPNYEAILQADSDACVSMDPFDVWLWFASRGDLCASHPNLLSALMLRHGALVFRKG